MLSFFNTITDRVPTYLPEEHDTKHQCTQPLQIGQQAPLFRIAPQAVPMICTNQGNGLLPSGQLIVQAKVVVFWSLEWNNYGIQFLKQVDAQQQAIRLMGGEVIVLTDEDSKMVKRISKLHNLSLNFYRDPENILAGRFGLHGETKMTRKLFRLRKRVHPYLGLYVIARDNRIAFSFAWSENRNGPSFRELLESVFEVYQADRS